jgi:stage V sporulation protein G
VEITEVRIKLMDDASDRLRAFCSVTLDDSFVVRDLKIIEGTNGPFVAMPSRKLTSHCPQCSCKNHLRAAYCNQCGLRLKDDLAIRDQEGRAKLYADIAHPINSQCREQIQDRVLDEYDTEMERSQQPDYISRYDDYYGDAGEEGDFYEPQLQRQSPQQHSQIQPPESQPRRPHTAPAQQPAAKSSPGGKSDGFGAGIF